MSNRQFEEGNTDGQDAGTLKVVGHGIVLDGDLRGHVTSGRLQRAQGNLPSPGRLLIGDLPPRGIIPDYRTPDVIFTRTLEPLTIGLHDPLPDDLALQLRAGVTGSDGFGRLGIFSNGSIRVPNGIALTLPDAGELTLEGHRIELGGGAGQGPQVTVRGGTVDLRSVGTFTHLDSDPGVLFIAGGTRIDTSGRWVNDNPLLFPGTPTGPAVIDGGSVSIKIGKPDARLDVSGGSAGGRAGSVSLQAPHGEVALEGEMAAAAQSGFQGGSFSLDASMLPGTVAGRWC